jgi:hypothetical protein
MKCQSQKLISQFNSNSEKASSSFLTFDLCLLPFDFAEGAVMKHTDRELNTILDDATAEIRNEKLDAAVVAGAAQRVQARLAGQQAAAEAGVAPVEHIRSCDDFRSLIPVYLQGQLSSARTMLLEDHTRECLPCRKALKEARHGRQSSWQLDSQKAKVTASNRRMTTFAGRLPQRRFWWSDCLRGLRHNGSSIRSAR